MLKVHEGKYDNLEIGTRIYYTGDIRNSASYGTITDIKPASKYNSKCYVIAYDEDRFESDTRISCGIWPVMFYPQPGRRFWLEAEWEADRQRRIEDMRRSFPKSAA